MCMRFLLICMVVCLGALVSNAPQPVAGADGGIDADGLYELGTTCTVEKSNSWVPSTGAGDAGNEIVQVFKNPSGDLAAVSARYLNISMEAVSASTPVFSFEVYTCADATCTGGLSRLGLQDGAIATENFWISYEVERNIKTNNQRAACAALGTTAVSSGLYCSAAGLTMDADEHSANPSWVAIELAASAVWVGAIGFSHAGSDYPTRMGVFTSGTNTTMTAQPASSTGGCPIATCSNSYFSDIPGECDRHSSACAAANCTAITNGMCSSELGAACVCFAGYTTPSTECAALTTNATIAECIGGFFDSAPLVYCDETTLECAASRCSGEGSCVGKASTDACNCDADHDATIVLDGVSVEVEERIFLYTPTPAATTHIELREAANGVVKLQFELYTCDATGGCQTSMTALGMGSGAIASSNITIIGGGLNPSTNPTFCARLGTLQDTADACTTSYFDLGNPVTQEIVRVTLREPASVYAIGIVPEFLVTTDFDVYYSIDNGDTFLKAGASDDCSTCGASRYGVACQVTQSACSSASNTIGCYGNGYCARNMANKTEEGYCVCKPGYLIAENCEAKCAATEVWSGAACVTDFVAADLLYCSNHGRVANSSIGQCISCDAGWVGPDCSTPLANCSADFCNGRGDCDDDTITKACTCDSNSNGRITTNLAVVSTHDDIVARLYQYFPLGRTVGDVIKEALHRLPKIVYTKRIRIKIPNGESTNAAGGRFRLYSCDVFNTAYDGRCSDVELFADGAIKLEEFADWRFSAGPKASTHPASCGKNYEDTDHVGDECSNGHGWRYADTTSSWWEIELPAPVWLNGIGIKQDHYSATSATPAQIDSYDVYYSDDSDTGNGELLKMGANCETCDSGYWAFGRTGGEALKACVAEDIETCRATRCFGNGDCTHSDSGCACDTGYSGVECELIGADAVDQKTCSDETTFYNPATLACDLTALECNAVRCQNQGECTNSLATCVCDAGRFSNTTAQCGMSQLTCDALRCVNNGTCNDVGCDCTETRFGHHIQGAGGTTLADATLAFLTAGVQARYVRIGPTGTAADCNDGAGGNGKAGGEFEIYTCTNADCDALVPRLASLHNNDFKDTSAETNNQPWCARLGTLPGQLVNGKNCTNGGWRSNGCSATANVLEIDLGAVFTINAIETAGVIGQSSTSDDYFNEFVLQVSLTGADDSWSFANMQVHCLQCSAGLYGSNCTETKTECDVDRCSGQGHCTGQYQGCSCKVGYSGDDCATCSSVGVENQKCAKCFSDGLFGPDCDMNQTVCRRDICLGRGDCDVFKECECENEYISDAQLNVNSFHTKEIFLHECVNDVKFVRVTPVTWQTQQGGFFEFYSCTAPDYECSTANCDDGDLQCNSKTALGMANLKIPNYAISAAASAGGHHPWCGRLGHENEHDLPGCTTVGWLAPNGGATQGYYFQVEFNSASRLCAIAVEGLDAGVYIKTAKIETSEDGLVWRNVVDQTTCAYCALGTYGHKHGNQLLDCHETDRVRAGETHCSGRGKTNSLAHPTHPNGTESICICDDGYAGVTCEQTDLECSVSRCSGNGECRDPAGTCLCDKPGYTSESACLAAHENCNDADCLSCKDGWYGRLCTISTATCRADRCGGIANCISRFTGCECDDDDCSFESNCEKCDHVEHPTTWLAVLGTVAGVFFATSAYLYWLRSNPGGYSAAV